jgi:hypothetical protein
VSNRLGGHFIFDLITPCQPLGGAQTYTRHLGSRNRKTVQRIHWNPGQKTLSIVVIVRSHSSKVSSLEAHRERAYAPLEVGRWLMDAEFIIGGAHDVATLRIATSCTPRVIIIARKSLCESAQAPESTRASPYRSVKLILILISDCSKVAKFVPLKARSHV